MAEIDFDKHQREVLRWRILKTAENAAPWAVAETLILSVVHGEGMQVTASSLRKEMRYLVKKGMAELHDDDKPVWRLSLTAAGEDVVQYTIPAPEGIGRPAKWW